MVKALAILLALAAAAPQGGGGSSDEARLARVRERRRALEKELTALRSEEKSVLGEVERLEVEVRLRGEELREIRITLKQTNREMDETLGKIRALEQSIARTRPVLAARSRALYKLGRLSYLRLLLSVEHPSDMFRGYRFVTALARRDRERIAGFRSDLASLSSLKADLAHRTQQALALRASLQQTRRRLDAERKRKTELLTSIVEKKELNAAYLKELRQAEDKLEKLLQGLAEGEVTVPLTAFKGSLPWPVPGKVTVPFGRRRHPRFDTYTIQNGIEIDAPPDSPVRAVHEGTVVFAERFRGYGLMVILDHGGKHYSLYAHLAETLVHPGQRVATGDVLGTVGDFGPDDRGLYFELRFQGRPLDPEEWLKKREP